MVSTRLRFAIPDVEFGCGPALKVNPSSFAGHELVVIFPPTEGRACAREIAAFARECDKFVGHDAWLLAFAGQYERKDDQAGRLLVIPDPDGSAWAAFCNLTGDAEEFDRDSGATFLFTRGGSLHRSWRGPGHLNEILEELAKPSSEHPHQLAR